jgi:hypothetical protein
LVIEDWPQGTPVGPSARPWSSAAPKGEGVRALRIGEAPASMTNDHFSMLNLQLTFKRITGASPFALRKTLA